jgi:hypothetical protein
MALTSCSKYFYAPMPPPTGFMTDSVRVRVSGGITLGDEHEAAYLNAAARVNAHVFLLGSGSVVTHPKTGTTTAGGGHVEIGPGYSWKIDPRSKSTFELAALGGFGTVALFDHHHGSTYSARSPHVRLALQPAICRVWKYGEAGFVSRFTYLHFSDPKETGMPSQDDMNPYFLEITRQYPNRLGWEPSVFLRAGLKNLKAELNYGLGYYSPSKGNLSNYYVSLGLVYILRPSGRN